MTEYVQFTPNPNGSFQFSPTLDQTEYVGTVYWSLFANRWMLNITSTNNILIVSRALTGSGDLVSVESATWAHGRAVLTTTAPHGLLVLGTFPLSISGMQPVAWNGVVEAFVIDPITIRYDLPTWPGDVLRYGQVGFEQNLVEGYFTTSRLVFRESTQQFEIST